MKKAVRLATMVTGTAAWAATMTPVVAQAAPVAPAATGKVTPNAIMGRVTPDATVSVCSSSRSVFSHTLILIYPNSGKHAPVCFQGSGYWHTGNTRFSGYCAAQMSGALEIKGKWYRFANDKAIHNLYKQVVSSVYLAPGGGAGYCRLGGIST
jgi:hypothetical protein